MPKFWLFWFKTLPNVISGTHSSFPLQIVTSSPNLFNRHQNLSKLLKLDSKIILGFLLMYSETLQQLGDYVDYL